jgi:predicted transcriptional regulator
MEKMYSHLHPILGEDIISRMSEVLKKEAITGRKMAEIMGISPSTSYRLLTEMEGMGLVERKKVMKGSGWKGRPSIEWVYIGGQKYSFLFSTSPQNETPFGPLARLSTPGDET